jgi:hypothetical protein
MAPQSTIPALKTALILQLNARPGLSGVQITWGPPSGEPSDDLIIVGDVTGIEHTRTTDRHRREDYILEVIVSCVANGTDHQTLTLRALSFWAEVETELHDNRTVNGTVQWANVVGADLREPANQVQMEARVNGRVNCTALK